MGAVHDERLGESDWCAVAVGEGGSDERGEPRGLGERQFDVAGGSACRGGAYLRFFRAETNVRMGMALLYFTYFILYQTRFRYRCPSLLCRFPDYRIDRLLSYSYITVRGE